MPNFPSTTTPARDRTATSQALPVVLILSTAEDISGGETFLLSLIEKLRMWTPVIATPNSALAQRCRALGAKAVVVRGLRSLHRENIPLAIWRLITHQLFALLGLLGLMLKYKVDIILSGSFSGAHFAFILSRVMSRPGLWTHLHPVFTPTDRDARLASWFLTKGRLKAIAVSSAIAQGFGPVGLDDSRVTIITTNIDTDHFQRRSSQRRNEKPVVVAMVAMITRWKGQSLLIDAVRLLRERGLTEKNFLCKFYGGVFENRSTDRRYYETLAQMVSQYGLQSHVHFCGKKEDMRAIYEDLDIVVSCSMKPEPSGISITEAMSMECIVLVPDEGGLTENVCDGHDGFKYKPRSLLDLANKLEHAIRNCESLGDVRRSARQTVCSRFSSTTMAEKYEALFTHLVSER